MLLEPLFPRGHLLTSIKPMDKNKILDEYGGLVRSITRRYDKLGISREDLVQEGSLALLKASEKFNPSSGIPFGAYAAIVIKYSICKYVSNYSRTVKIPSNIRCRLIKAKAARKTLAEKLKRDPSDRETAEFMGVSELAVKGSSFADIRTVSIHTPINEDGGFFEEILPDERPTHEELLADKEIYERLEVLVDSLPEGQKSIIRQRYGLDGGEPATQEEIGLAIGKSAQRIGQIELEVLERLKERME